MIEVSVSHSVNLCHRKGKQERESTKVNHANKRKESKKVKQDEGRSKRTRSYLIRENT
jgi:hypothetical protein